MIERLRHPHAAGGVLLALLVIGGQVEAWSVDPEASPRLVLVACALVATGALVLWWRAPEVSTGVAIGAFVVKDAFGGPGELLTVLLCGVLAAFGVGLRLPTRRSLVGLTGALALAAVGVLVGPESGPSELVFSAIVVGLPWGAGRLLRGSHHHTAVLEELAASRERATADEVRLAAADERGRIAREVHDLVGHSVSTMIVQAGAAEEVLARRPEDAISSLRAVQETGRHALDDLHRVLGLLHERTDDEERQPVPGLDRLPELLETFRHARLELQTELRGELADLPEGISLVAYRIVQEGLTNVVRHADGAPARLVVDRTDDELALEISDQGPGPVRSNSSGHGLIGIRERVAMYDGCVEAGPRAGGGFRVAVRLPLVSGA